MSAKGLRHLSMMAAVAASLGASALGAPSERVSLGGGNPGTHWPHPTKKRYRHADRLKRYKAQRAANRQRRKLAA